MPIIFFFFFFFNDTATTEIYTLSLHDALPILRGRMRASRGATADRKHRQERRADSHRAGCCALHAGARRGAAQARRTRDRKSTRLNSSHLVISYAVFCLKKKKKKIKYKTCDHIEITELC